MNHAESLPKLYGELASWWPLLSPPEDYAEEAAIYRRLLAGDHWQSPRTVLELGSGGGNNAFHLKPFFRMTLVDRSAAMLAVSHALNPECEHLAGDMRSIRLGRQFDAVFIHDAIAYMTTPEDLRRALETACLHCKPGGVLLVVPDCTRETFRPTTSHGGRDGADRALRYLEWTWDPNPHDSSYRAEHAYLLREGLSVRHEYDHHVLGLFGRTEWLQLLAAAGFPHCALHFERLSAETEISPLFVARKEA